MKQGNASARGDKATTRRGYCLKRLAICLTFVQNSSPMQTRICHLLVRPFGVHTKIITGLRSGATSFASILVWWTSRLWMNKSICVPGP